MAVVLQLGGAHMTSHNMHYGTRNILDPFVRNWLGQTRRHIVCDYFKMATVNRATRGCSTVKCCLYTITWNRYQCVRFRRFSLPGEVNFQNTIQKHDANSCISSLLDRIGRCTTAPITFYRYSCAKQPKFTEVGEGVPNGTMADSMWC